MSEDWTHLVAHALLESELGDEAQLLVLAAMQGDAELADLTGRAASSRPPETQPPEPSAPSGAFLQRLDVRAFRGVGAEASLTLKPGPGLTIVAGRNGSGKSSFAEGLEIALTGASFRFTKKSTTQWQRSWRNVHADSSPRIRLVLAEEGVGSTSVFAQWSGDELASLTREAQRPGQPRRPVAELGWAAALQTYRPMLSDDEIGEVLAGGPSQLYDMLSAVLGLQVLTEAIERLAKMSGEFTASQKQLTAAKKSLLGELAAVADERAHRAGGILRSRAPGVDELRGLATGTTPDETAATLRALADLVAPDPRVIDTCATELRNAVDAVAVAGAASVEAVARRSALPSAAIHLHDLVGDHTCPVCASGTLDGARVKVLALEVDDSSAELAEFRRARERLLQARDAARATVGHGVPDCFDKPMPEPLTAQLDDVRGLWETWALLPEGDLALVDHLRTHGAVLSQEAASLSAAAQELLDRRDDAWAPLASRLAGYANDLAAWQTVAEAAAATKAALDWLKKHDLRLKNDRLQPIVKQVRAIWAELRQESNVDIADLELTSTTTRRHVEFRTSVDGHPTEGITVLSQGELHALALAVFLPRATLPDSPFRFVVMDDPVQAMDPAKVDGLLSVLTGIARDRQVVVFTHDDRLADAARRGAVDATILEVSREEGSAVSVRDSLDPAQRWLDDAFALERDERLPEATKRRLLPGIHRMAVESAARDRHFSREYGHGALRADVEQSWEAHRKTGTRVSLAVFGEQRDLTHWLEQAPHRKRALGVCSAALHTGLVGSTRGACEDVRDLLQELRRA